MKVQSEHDVFSDWKRVRRFLGFSSIALLLLAFFLVVYWGVALALILGFFFFYVLSPLVSLLEVKGLKRYYGIPLIISLLVAMLVIAFWFILPVIYTQVYQLISLAPQAVNNFIETNVPLIQDKMNEIPILSEFDFESFVQEYTAGEETGQRLVSAIAGVWSGTHILLSRLLFVLLVPLITFVLLIEEPKFKAYFWRMIPRDLVLPMKVFITRMNRDFLLLGRGLLTVALIVGVLYMVGFSLVGLKFALLIGALAGISRIIPYLDVLVAAVLSAVAIFADFQGWGQVLMVLGVFAFVFTIDGVLVTPKIIGESVGLHPVFLIISILAFGYWGGVMGVLIAIPLLTFCKVILKSALPFYYASPLYKPHYEEYRKP